MVALTVLRRLAEQHSYHELKQVCVAMESHDAAVAILGALADTHLGSDVDLRVAALSASADKLDVDAKVDLAAVFMALGKLDRAVAILQSAPQAELDHPLRLARLAWCRLQMGERREAVELYQQSLQIRPRMGVYHNLLLIYLDSGDFENLATVLETAQLFWAKEQADWPEAQRCHYSRQLRKIQLDLWLARGQFERAEAYIDRERELLREQDWCLLVCAFAERLAQQHRYSEAEEWLRRALRHYNSNVSLFSQLAELAKLQGRSRQAIRLQLRSVQLAGLQERSAIHLHLGLASLTLHSHPELAADAVEQAKGDLVRFQDDPAYTPKEKAEWQLRVDLASADVQTSQQQYDDAERGYRDILAKWPECAPALQGFGRLVLQLGRVDEAVALFEQLKTIDPISGHAALINVRVLPENSQMLDRLEELACKSGSDGGVHTGLLLQLANAREQVGDYEKAFELAEKANTFSRQSLTYDPQNNRQRCARIRHAFPRQLFERRSNIGSQSDLPVFIVGMPRSGTTLVEQIIAGHSRIHGAGELGAIPRVIAGLNRWERHVGSGRSYPDCVDDLDAGVVEGITRGIVDELREYAPSADFVVDKLPHNFENVGLIKLLFPNAKIISVRRDPRDIAISNYFTDYAGKNSGMAFAYNLDWIGEQLADHNLLMNHWRQLFGSEIFEIHYEDLIDDPESGARSLLDFIGVEWEASVLDFFSLQRPVKTASLWQVRQPIYHGSKGKWQHYQKHLGPLIAATNRQITWQPITMETLPVAGWMNTGVDYYRSGDLDAAERLMGQLLHHLPEHGAARYMLGLIYLQKGHQDDGIALLRQAVDRCPWNQNWHNDLVAALQFAGRESEAAQMSELDGTRRKRSRDFQSADAKSDPALDYLFLSEESACSAYEFETSGNNP